MGWFLLIISLLAVPVARGADDNPTPVAINPATEALNSTADAIAMTRPLPGLLSREHPRISQIIGARVHGNGGEVLGEVVEMMLREEGPLAVLRTGRLTGSMVGVPASDFRWLDGKLVLPGVTAEGLGSRPPFHFDTPPR